MRLSRWQAALLKGVGSVLSAGASRGALLVLTYHRVLTAPDPLLPGEPDARAFASQMDLIRELCQVLPLAEGMERLVAGALPARAVAITFDDGYANNRAIAAPLLAERRMPATVFVASGYVGGGRMWNDTVIEVIRRARMELDLTPLGLPRYLLADDAERRRAINEIIGAIKYRPPEQRQSLAAAMAEKVGCELPDDLMMSEAQLKELASFGIEVGAHTVTHPILARIDDETAWREVRDGKGALEDIMAGPVAAFAYPNGVPNRDFKRVHVDMVRKAGFSVAVTTAWGSAGPRADRLQVPRALPWDASAFRFGARLVATYGQRRTPVA